MTRETTSSPGDPASKLQKEILDQLRGLEAKGSPGLAAQVLEIFLQDTSSRLIALREAIGRRDGEATYQAAHTMQGSAGMVGFASMAERCRELAEAARAESFDQCEALAAALDTGFQAIQLGLSAFMAPFDTSAFIGKFVEEARDRLKALNEALLCLEQAPGDPGSHEAIGEAMRQAHSLNGSAQMLGFSDMSQISHQLEDLFVAGGRNSSLLTGDAFGVVFAAVDLLSARVEQLGHGMLEPVEIGELCRKLTGLLTPGVAAKASSPQDDEPSIDSMGRG